MQRIENVKEVEKKKKYQHLQFHSYYSTIRSNCLQQTILIRKTRNKMRVWKIKQIKYNCNEKEYKFKCQG